MQYLKLRRQPSKKEKLRMILESKNRCFYCGIKIGTLYFRKGKFYFTRIHWDHFIPFSYMQNNKKENYRLSCNICNSLKSNLMFDEIESVRKYILNKIKKGGYEFYEDKKRNDKNEMFGMWNYDSEQSERKKVLRRQMPIRKLVKKTSASKPRDKNKSKLKPRNKRYWKRGLNFQTSRFIWIKIPVTRKEKILRYRLKHWKTLSKPGWIEIKP